MFSKSAREACENVKSKVGQKKSPHQPAVSKTLVRNCELNPPVKDVADNCNGNAEVNPLPECSSRQVHFKDEPKSILSEPCLNSALNVKDYIQKVKCQSSHPISGCKEIKLKTRDVKRVHTSGLKKTNIPFEEKIFKGLIDLKVSEEDLGISAPVKPKEFVKVKEPEPVLSDYYKPVFNKEYTIKPNPPTFDIERQTYFTGSSVLNATKKWEV